ncbi:MFS transporter [Cellvibrio sp. OA-2007]|uniref:MFS transporter n=1 Tax=Cellvibrio sp. OA-2007 TaxID=529823 RepID=UPI000784B6E6|nr:MFS transporter [Cellvibrio sp. OA-2007]
MVQLSTARERALLYTLMALQFTVIVDFMIMMPLSSQLMDAFAIQPAEFGLLVSSYSLAAGASALLASAIADRFDRRHALLMCYLGLAIATLGCGLADSYLLLLIARIIAGFFGGVMSAVALAILGDVIPPQRRGQAMGVVMLAFSLAAVAGVPLGLFIANHYQWQTPFLLLAVVCVLVLVVSWFVVPPVREHLQQQHTPMLQSYRDLLSVPNHWWGFVTSSLVMFGGFMVIPYIAPAVVANTELSNSDLPYIYLVGGAVTLITRPMIAKLTDTYPHAQVFTWIVLLSFIPIILVTQTLQVGLLWHLLMAALFFIFVSGRFIPCSALVTASCEPRFRGRVMAFNSAMQNLGSGVAAFVAGLIMVKSNSGELLHYDWVGFIACLVGLLTIWTAKKVKAIS